MGDPKTDAKPLLLTRAVKTIGRVLGPTTTSGKAFGFVEKNLSRVIDSVGQSETYLDMAGRALNRRFQSRVKRNSTQENILHALRLPTSTEVAHLHREVRSLHDQMEALTTQLEVVLESMEKNQSGAAHRKEETS